jgi:hypothetical protein
VKIEERPIASNLRRQQTIQLLRTGTINLAVRNERVELQAHTSFCVDVTVLQR